jgi:hypothetical protein
MMTVAPTNNATPAVPGDEQSPMMLGERLLAQATITPVQLEYALQKQKVEGGRLGQILIAHGLLTERDLALNLAQQRSVDFMAAEFAPVPDPQLMSLFNRELCLTRGFMYEEMARWRCSLEAEIRRTCPIWFSVVAAREQDFSRGSSPPSRRWCARNSILRSTPYFRC